MQGAKIKKIMNFLRIMLRLDYHNFEFLLPNVILGKIELSLTTPVLLLPEVAYCRIKSIGFLYKYFWIQVWLQLTTHFGVESFSGKKFAKFSAQTFGNDKMTRISWGINFGEGEICIHVFINYSTRKLLQKSEN